MTGWEWIIILAKIVELIAGGMGRAKAVACVASTYDVSEGEIWKHGGF